MSWVTFLCHLGSALTLGNRGLTKPCNGGNASASQIDVSADTKSAAFAKGDRGRSSRECLGEKIYRSHPLAGKKKTLPMAAFFSQHLA